VSEYARVRSNYNHLVEEMYCEAQAVMDRLYPLYYKTAGKIASIAELVEEWAKEFASGEATSEVTAESSGRSPAGS